MLKNVNRDALVRALRRAIPELGEEWSCRYADRLIEETDPRLEENVTEWIEGRALTDVRFPAADGGEYGIVQILQRWSNDDFVGALRIMNEFFCNEPLAIAKMDRRAL